MRRPWLSYAVRVAALALAYLIVAKFGLLFAFVQGNVSPVWPASGLALAALFLFGLRLWPGIALGGFVASLSTGVTLPTAFGIAVGGMLGSLAGATVLR